MIIIHLYCASLDTAVCALLLHSLLIPDWLGVKDNSSCSIYITQLNVSIVHLHLWLPSLKACYFSVRGIMYFYCSENCWKALASIATQRSPPWVFSPFLKGNNTVWVNFCPFSGSVYSVVYWILTEGLLKSIEYMWLSGRAFCFLALLELTKKKSITFSQ